MKRLFDDISAQESGTTGRPLPSSSSRRPELPEAGNDEQPPRRGCITEGVSVDLVGAVVWIGVFVSCGLGTDWYRDIRWYKYRLLCRYLVIDEFCVCWQMSFHELCYFKSPRAPKCQSVCGGRSVEMWAAVFRHRWKSFVWTPAAKDARGCKRRWRWWNRVTCGRLQQLLVFLRVEKMVQWWHRLSCAMPSWSILHRRRVCSTRALRSSAGATIEPSSPRVETPEAAATFRRTSRVMLAIWRSWCLNA